MDRSTSDGTARFGDSSAGLQVEEETSRHHDQLRVGEEQVAGSEVDAADTTVDGSTAAPRGLAAAHSMSLETIQDDSLLQEGGKPKEDEHLENQVDNGSMITKSHEIGQDQAKELHDGSQDASRDLVAGKKGGKAQGGKVKKTRDFPWYTPEFLHLSMSTRPITRKSVCNKREGYNFFGKWSFSYMDEMIKRGYRRNLEFEEFPEVETEDKASLLSERILNQWNKDIEKNPDKARLWWSTLKAFKYEVLLTAAINFFENIFITVQGYALGQILLWLQSPTRDDDANKNKGYYWTILLSICVLVHSVVHHAVFHTSMRLGMQLRVGFISVIYRKALQLSTKNTSSTGLIVNMVSNDVQRFEEAAVFFHYIWISPIQLAVVTYLIYLEISWACFAAVGVLILMIPIQSYLASIFKNFRERMLVFRDDRIKSISDMLAGIMVVKLYAWEFPFMDKVRGLRNRELHFTLLSNNLRAMNESIYFFTPALIGLLGFGVFFAIEKDFNPSNIFATLTYIAGVRLNMSNFFPKGLQFASEATVSFERIEEFLRLEDLKRSTKDLEAEELKQGKVMSLKDCTFEWIDNTPVLSNLTLDFTRPSLTVLCGPVGGGKSSLLNALMGELPAVTGTYRISPDAKIAYASQIPWITAGTIKENILFGLPYDEQKLKDTIEATSMIRDISLFEYGIDTIIGERGVSLSGGQKARLSLARAVYADRDIYLLDDPLSAVDTKVARHLFEKCIKGILKNKTVILITHQLQFIPDCERIAVLERGTMTALGDWELISKTDSKFCKTLVEFNEHDNDEEVETDIDSPMSDTEYDIDEVLKRSAPASILLDPDVKNTTEKVEITSDPIKEELEKDENDSIFEDVNEAESDEDEVENKQVFGADEVVQEGSVGLRIYLEFFRMGSNYLYIGIMVMMLIVGEVTNDAASYWLSHWTQLPDDRKYQNRNLWIYFSLVIVTIVIAIIRALCFFYMCLASTRAIFNQMLAKVFMTGMHFFHVNPHGRIMNRFSKDLGLLDETLPLTFFDVMQETFMIIGVIVISAIAIPPFLVFVPFLLYGLVLFRNFFIPTSRQIKRFESITRSPVYSAVPSTLEGLSTIRAFEASETFKKKFLFLQDENTRMYFQFLSCSRWLGFRLDAWCSIFVIAVAFCVIALRNSLSFVNPAKVGLILTYLIQLTGSLQWAARQSAEIENYMVNVERALEYTKLESEEEMNHCNPVVVDPPKEWPQHGAIELKNVVLTYPGTRKPVLKNLNIQIPGGVRIGIVGRTGAGKSSMLQALFRLVEPEGEVIIDDVVTSGTPLQTLRSRISIIPQEPFCFKGTMRFNIDPFGTVSDEELWTVLKVVSLDKSIEAMAGGLDAEVAENGSNMSVGERQLVCLARAMVRKSQIVVMDEATSNVDMNIDEIIQNSIKGGVFGDATVLTIAHRLQTVAEYDFIIVMEAGQIIEVGNPWELLDPANANANVGTIKTGAFESMVAEMTEDAADALRYVARDSYNATIGAKIRAQEPVPRVVAQVVTDATRQD